MTPRVRVVVLNYNGGELTLDCLRRLRRTEWPAGSLEIVLVDNASDDDVVARVRQDLPDVRVVESAFNRGFAGGCNLALRDLAGVDHVALVNNDVSVEPDWLRPLVDCLEADPSLGAACPKIRLSQPYLDVEIGVSRTFRRGRGDRRQLGVRLSGVRVDGKDCWRLAQPWRGFWGPEHGEADEAEYQWTGARAVLRVPVPGDREAPPTCELRLAADFAMGVDVVSGREEERYTVGTRPGWHSVSLDGEVFEVINNVGSIVVDDGYGADRGYLERDVGQYETEADVFAWCGAAGLLRARYLADVGLFDERLFLYYEDFELSWRGRTRGWRYRYVPASVVRHVHSATSVEGSARSHYYNERNRLLVVTRYAPLSRVLRAVVRYLLITASYARRDLLGPFLRGAPPRGGSVRRRLRAFAGYLRLAPWMLLERRARVRSRSLPSSPIISR
ncbi:MAG: glycosyltransferase [Acidimicrobiia bacterium]